MTLTSKMIHHEVLCCRSCHLVPMGICSWSRCTGIFPKTSVSVSFPQYPVLGQQRHSKSVMIPSPSPSPSPDTSTSIAHTYHAVSPSIIKTLTISISSRIYKAPSPSPLPRSCRLAFGSLCAMHCRLALVKATILETFSRLLRLNPAPSPFSMLDMQHIRWIKKLFLV